MNKYIYTALSVMLVCSIIVLIILSVRIRKLNRENAVLNEHILIKEAVIKDSNINIQLLQEQVNSADKICENRIKARQDVIKLQSPALSYGKIETAVSSTQHGETNEVINKNKSDFAVDSINNYWMQFIQQNSNGEQAVQHTE